MRRKRLLLVLIILFESIIGFGKQPLPIDTTKSFKVNGVWVTPKTSFKFDTLGIISTDTLPLTSCADYVYFPFGPMKDKRDLKHSLLKSFTVTDKKYWAGGEVFPINILKADFDKLILFFDKNKEDAKSSYVIKGEIMDSTIHFINGIKIGMNLDDFYNKFFDLFPTDLQKKYKVVTIATCDYDLTHVYTFKNGKLISVGFICDERYWRVEY